jgi:hypothetical protein
MLTLGSKSPTLIPDVADSPGHTRGKVTSGFTQDNGPTTGHVF